MHQIMVIDDDREFLDFMEDALTSEGWSIICSATSSFTTIQQVRQLQPQVIILDLRFNTGLGGVMLLKALKDDPQICSVPVIICTADHEFLRTSRDQLRDCFSILEKPFLLETLYRHVQAAASSTSAQVYS